MIHRKFYNCSLIGPDVLVTDLGFRKETVLHSKNFYDFSYASLGDHGVLATNLIESWSHTKEKRWGDVKNNSRMKISRNRMGFLGIIEPSYRMGTGGLSLRGWWVGSVRGNTSLKTITQPE